MKILLRILFTLMLIYASVLYIQAQNLVPNPSFEDTLSCPLSDSDMDAVNYWIHGTIPSADYFNSCEPSNWVSVPQNYVGYQFARTGNAYCGLYTYHPFNSPDTSYREYFEVRLTDTLVNGETYQVEFYTNLSDSSNYANGISAYLSNDSVFSGSMTNLTFTPQVETIFGNPITDKVNWVKVAGTFIASGGEKFLTIGNFRNNLNSDTLNIGGGGSSLGIDYLAAYYYIDDIAVYKDTLTSIESLDNEFKVNIFPNPSYNGVVNISTNSNSTLDIEVFNLIGENVSFIMNENNKGVSLHLNKGSYIIRLNNENKITHEKILILN